MERITKLFLILITVFLVVFAADVEGARTIKSNVKVDQPQNFFGGPGSPGFGLPFPIPGFGGFPSPGLPFPSPGFGFGPPGSFCSFFPSPGCAPPPNPGGSLGGGSSGSP